MDAALGAALGLSAEAPVPGGCIHRCYRALRGGRPVFVKANEPRFADAFAAEADGLDALRRAGHPRRSRTARPAARPTC
jgi:fructosamine-3-kinase